MISKRRRKNVDPVQLQQSIKLREAKMSLIMNTDMKMSLAHLKKIEIMAESRKKKKIIIPL